MKTTVYTHKTSSRRRMEQVQRDEFLHRRMMAEGHKSELKCLAYGGRPITDDGKLLVSGWKAIDQRSTIKHTTHGDFSHLHANPLICK
ncbi:hypothetical protein HOS81_gp05 [Escherichia phage YZ1]|uniref:Uncharacterized protein n=1 Tax=Escherichia phage YZ1 TaxID=2079534 RepID=A0A2L0HPF2_9CAUD|nr:hypothetical protein HOS81_gp05 [Escherichia phage YZ1]AUX83593.1 hypothetical protein [Escherichia phage YZ1]